MANKLLALCGAFQLVVSASNPVAPLFWIYWLHLVCIKSINSSTIHEIKHLLKSILFKQIWIVDVKRSQSPTHSPSDSPITPHNCCVNFFGPSVCNRAVFYGRDSVHIGHESKPEREAWIEGSFLEFVGGCISMSLFFRNYLHHTLGKIKLSTWPTGCKQTWDLRRRGRGKRRAVTDVPLKVWVTVEMLYLETLQVINCVDSQKECCPLFGVGVTSTEKIYEGQAPEWEQHIGGEKSSAMIRISSNTQMLLMYSIFTTFQSFL